MRSDRTAIVSHRIFSWAYPKENRLRLLIHTFLVLINLTGLLCISYLQAFLYSEDITAQPADNLLRLCLFVLFTACLANVLYFLLRLRFQSQASG